jgi:hypothetical protein
MFLNFAAVLAQLTPNAAFRIANATRPPGDYLWEAILPETPVWSYIANSGNMTVHATMAGLVGMDSPYPPGGYVSVSTFLEQLAKIAIEVPLKEEVVRQLQQMLMQLQVSGTPTNEIIMNEALNFLQKLVVQPLIDSMEWLRGQALTTGAINWTYNGKSLVVSYGVPAANILAQRTGTDVYDGTTSKFWADIVLLRQRLRGNLRAIVAHPDTVDRIRYNPANNAVAVQEDAGGLTFRKIVPATGAFTNDVADIVQIVKYDREGEILNPADPTSTIIVPFCQRNKLVAIGNNNRTGYRVGEGSTDDPNRDNPIGYTHLGPTVEGGGRPGRWAQLYTPEAAPWELRGRGAMNGMPVIEAPDKIAVASTA